MPTGYTAILHERDVSFPEFATQCARAFGACIHLRDRPLDATYTPEPYSTYHAEQLQRLAADLALLRALSVADAMLALTQERRTNHEAATKRIAELNVIAARYAKMRQQVEDWVVPTDAHKDMKRFMLQQLDMCRHDCDTSYYDELLAQPVEVTDEQAQQWLTQKIAQVQSSIAYHTRQRDEDAARVDQRNGWMKQLQDSLK